MLRTTRASDPGAFVAVFVLLLVPASARAFSLLLPGGGPTVEQVHQGAARWSSTSGLSDGIQVGVATGFAQAFGAQTAQEIAAVNQAVAGAIDAWESPVLGFDVTFDAAVQEGEADGFEIDLFAVDSSHPAFFNNIFFGRANVATFSDSNRPLTNGMSFAGDAISGADLFFATDRANTYANYYGFTEQQRLDALKRLVMHEVGHALGLGHPNTNSPYLVEVNYDTDTDPLNPIAIDPRDPFADLIQSASADNMAIMSNAACGSGPEPCPAFFFTSLRNDEIGGRDVLYPTVPPPPANDAYFHAVVIGAGSVSGTLLQATNDGGASFGTPGLPDVWFTYTASDTGTLYVDTCGTHDAAGPDTVLSLHSSGPGTTANELTVNDDWPSGDNPTACQGLDNAPERDSAVILEVTQGQRIWIRIAPFSSSLGSGAFQLELTLFAPGADPWQSATVLGLLGRRLGSLVGATNDGSASVGNPGQPDVWYKYTASRAGTLVVDTCGTHDTGGPDTVLSLHSSGPGTTANQLVANDDWPSGSDPTACQDLDAPPSYDSAVALSVTAGQTVWIRVSQYAEYTGGDGAFQLRLGLENDTWQEASSVGFGSVIGTLAGATNDGSATVGDQHHPDVWYTYTAPEQQWLSVDTCGSDDASGFDSALSLHSSGPGSTVNELAANDNWPFGSDPTACSGLDAPPSYDSALLHPIGAGETVLIRVSSFDDSPGVDFVLRLPEPGVALSVLFGALVLAASRRARSTSGG